MEKFNKARKAIPKFDTIQQKIAKTGTVKGKTSTEIIARCGPPNSISVTAGKTMMQWMQQSNGISGTTSYHVALLFDANDICLGISHESSVSV